MQNVPRLTTVTLDSAAETSTGFFTATQYGTLTKLAEILVPPVKGHPGAIDARAPEFLDFLISRSPAASQTLYRNGLDGLNAAAKKHFHKPFAELDAKQADTIIRPLLVARAWDREEPKDPMQHFMVGSARRLASSHNELWRMGRFGRQHWPRPIQFWPT